MITVTVSDAALRQAAEEGMDEFVKVFIDGIQKAIGGQLTNENMARLNADQITLLAGTISTKRCRTAAMCSLSTTGWAHLSSKTPLPA